LEDAAQPREHGQSAVLQFLDLQLFQVTRFGQAQRVKSATRGDVTRDESVVKRVGRQASSVRFGTANQDGFDDQNVPEGRVARAFRRQRGNSARELVRNGGAVIRGAQGTGGEPRDTGAVFGGPGTSDAQLGPSAVDDFTLGVLFVAERDDRGFAPTRVRTEFRVDVSLDNLGDGLGLRRVKRERRKKSKLKVQEPLVANQKKGKIFSLAAQSQNFSSDLSLSRARALLRGNSDQETKLSQRAKNTIFARLRPFSFIASAESMKVLIAQRESVSFCILFSRIV
jgi:hypothetical protein